MEQTLPRSLQKGTKAVHIWISDFWPPGLGEDKYLCFKHHPPQTVALCRGCPRKLVHVGLQANPSKLAIPNDTWPDHSC